MDIALPFQYPPHVGKQQDVVYAKSQTYWKVSTFGSCMMCDVTKIALYVSFGVSTLSEDFKFLTP